MRLYIKISKATQTINFNYQQLLTGCIHKWMGENNTHHGKVSLYSFSWLQNVEVVKGGIKVKDGSYFFISFYDTNLLKITLKNIMNDPEMFFEVKVLDVQIRETPQFSNKERFLLASPVLIKRYQGEENTHYTFMDPQADKLLTETLITKAKIAGLSTEGLKVYFDKEYPNPKTKIVSYKKIENRVNICPVIVEGSAEIIAFAWDVGLGNSTGIGFGALK